MDWQAYSPCIPKASIHYGCKITELFGIAQFSEHFIAYINLGGSENDTL